MNPIVYTTKPESNSLPGFWEPTSQYPELSEPPSIKLLKGLSKDEAFIIENAISPRECNELIRFMNCSPNFEEVGVQGMKDKKDERIGSLRTSIWSPSTAENIWNKINYLLPVVHRGVYTATDWYQFLSEKELYEGGLKYLPVAISPLLRFMQYNNGGQHYAHYDASYIYPNYRYRTLKSMVIYLTTNEGAATRFVNDGQESVFIWDRNHDDWSRPVKPEEVIAKSECIAGNILIFNHRLCHDVEHYFGDNKRIIIRGDVVYKQDGAY